MVSHTSTQARCTVPAPGGACTRHRFGCRTIDEQLVTETVGEFFTDGHFDISVDPDDPKVYADGEDISEAIRSSEVSSHVSKVSNIIPVRHVLIAAQRAYIAREASVDSFSEGAGIVAEGRDITTVVAPDAEVRILLTAREEVRQARRSGQAVSGVGAENGRGTRQGRFESHQLHIRRGRRVDRRQLRSQLRRDP